MSIKYNSDDSFNNEAEKKILKKVFGDSFKMSTKEELEESNREYEARKQKFIDSWTECNKQLSLDTNVDFPTNLNFHNRPSNKEFFLLYFEKENYEIIEVLAKTIAGKLKNIMKNELSQYILTHIYSIELFDKMTLIETVSKFGILTEIKTSNNFYAIIDNSSSSIGILKGHLLEMNDYDKMDDEISIGKADSLKPLYEKITCAINQALNFDNMENYIESSNEKFDFEINDMIIPRSEINNLMDNEFLIHITIETDNIGCCSSEFIGINIPLNKYFINYLKGIKKLKR